MDCYSFIAVKITPANCQEDLTPLHISEIINHFNFNFLIIAAVEIVS